jgi:hypothetical protein
MNKRPSEKNTKAEILTAFDELLKEKKALETMMQGVNEVRTNGKQLTAEIMKHQSNERKKKARESLTIKQKSRHI